jgi:RNA polymerase sigma-70 factor (ECF subfamily)
MSDAPRCQNGSPVEPLTSVLMLRAQSGDLARFGELYERVAPAVYGWASLRIRSSLRGRLEAEEIVQETWCRALRKLDEYDAARGTFRNWIFGLAKNVLFEALRTLQSPESSHDSATARVFALENQPDVVTSVTKRLAREDGLRHFLQRVAALGEDEKILVLLCGFEGLTSEEAGLRLNVKAETVKKRWQRLRAELIARDLPRDLFVPDASD